MSQRVQVPKVQRKVPTAFLTFTASTHVHVPERFIIFKSKVQRWTKKREDRTARLGFIFPVRPASLMLTFPPLRRTIRS